MAETKNLMGLNLNVDSELMAEAAKEAIIASDKCCSRMEYIVRKAFSDIVREELAAMLEEQKPVLRELIRKEFQKKQVQSQFVEMFMASLADSVTDRYSTTINVEFAAKKERY